MTQLSRLIAFTVCVTLSSAVADAQRPPQLRVRLVPEISDPRDWINGPAWAELLKECRRIWSAEQVEVVGEDDASGADITIPLVFDHLQLLKHDSPKGNAFGVTLFRGLTRQILVSVPRAREAAYRDSAVGASGISSGGVLDTTMARILGRVVAHEVGHVLLAKAGHGTSGLMRADVEIRDLHTAADRRFALSPGERASLATRFRNRYAPQSPAGVLTDSPAREEPVTAARGAVAARRGMRVKSR